jgi:hypothetical protein
MIALVSTAETDCISWSHRRVEEDIPLSGSAKRRLASREEDNNSEQVSERHRERAF